MNLAVLGTGYVGLVTGVCFAGYGHQVICADLDEDKVATLERGQSTIFEARLQELLEKELASRRLTFTTDLEAAVGAAEIVFIAVGTPCDEEGKVDLRQVFAAAELVADFMTSSKILVIKSTVPPGTCRDIRCLIEKKLQSRRCDVAFEVVSNPEFLSEGSAVADCLRPSRIVLGADSQFATKRLFDLYASFVEDASQIVVMDSVSAELTKYAANAMLAARISFMNELSRLCDSMGADIEHIRRGIGSDERIGPYFLRAGIGYGGSCFPKDVRALSRLARDLHIPLKLIPSIAQANDRQKEYFFERIKTRFAGELAGKQISIWGLAFKAGTDDVRESPALDLLSALTASGAEVHVYDPLAREKFREAMNHLLGADKVKAIIFEDPYTALVGSDALCILTEWNGLESVDLGRVRAQLKQPIVFDGRNVFDFESIQTSGLEYHPIGRPTYVSSLLQM